LKISEEGGVQRQSAAQGPALDFEDKNNREVYERGGNRIKPRSAGSGARALDSPSTSAAADSSSLVEARGIGRLLVLAAAC